MEELQSLNAELESKFDEYIRADFNSQSEGLIDQIHRNAALKVTFAKKRLQKSLATQENKSKRAEDLYCTQCTTDLIGKKTIYCKICIERPACETD